MIIVGHWNSYKDISMELYIESTINVVVRLAREAREAVLALRGSQLSEMQHLMF